MIKIGEFEVKKVKIYDHVGYETNKKKQDGYNVLIDFDLKRVEGEAMESEWITDFSLVIKKIDGKEEMHVSHNRVYFKYNICCGCCYERQSSHCNYFTKNKIEKLLQGIKEEYPEIKAFLEDEETLQELALARKKRNEELHKKRTVVTKEPILDDQKKGFLEALQHIHIADSILEETFYLNAEGHERDDIYKFREKIRKMAWDLEDKLYPKKKMEELDVDEIIESVKEIRDTTISLSEKGMCDNELKVLRSYKRTGKMSKKDKKHFEDHMKYWEKQKLLEEVHEEKN